MRLIAWSALAQFVLSLTQAQVIITSEDMFNQVGLYYKAYINDGDVSVVGRLGTKGGPQAWDFTGGPKDQILRFDYVGVNDDGRGEGFSKAKFAERKTNETDGSRSWLFLEQVPGLGRVVYGFYEQQFVSLLGATSPSHLFKTPIVDFPETIKFGDSWGTSTSYKSDILLVDTEVDPNDPELGGFQTGISIVVNVSSTMTVDAHGIINQPGIGFGEALRVNELSEYNIEADIFGDGNLQSVATEYVRSYYWLREDHGIAVQITSKQQSSPPPDNFTTAAAFVRMFETNHPIGVSVADAITGFKITLGKNQVLLNWDSHPKATSYRVEFTTNPAAKESWQPLQTTEKNFLIDSTVRNSETRFYRIRSVN